jgi:N-acetylmuramoyl-L-alanine amidase
MIAILTMAVLTVAEVVPPTTLTIISGGRERRVPIRTDLGAGPVLPAGPLLMALNGTAASDGVWIDLTLGSRAYRFLLGAPIFTTGGRLHALAAPATVRRDSLFIPFQFVAELLPRLQAPRFHYDRGSARLTDLGPPATTAEPRTAAGAPSGMRETSLQRVHKVTIDPGHGGVDPGNPGLYFPKGVKEKHVTLQIGLLLARELEARGVEVDLTRTRDTLIDLRDRGGFCTSECDLFVSLHVNSLPRRRGYTSVRGFETYFLAEARTEDAVRVERMENEAVRFERPAESGEAGGALDFILKDLQLNEYLRESARVAELVQQHLDRPHPGENRGVKQAGFTVLTTARRPAVLVELGYATNREDARVMSRKASQEALARALADAVVAYLREYERKTDGR